MDDEIRGQLLEWMEARVKNGDFPAFAAEQAVERGITEFGGEAIARLTGPMWLHDEWREEQQDVRRGRFGASHLAKQETDAIDRGESPELPVGMGSVYDIKVPAGKFWYRIGDLTVESIERIKNFYLSLVRTNASWARRYKRLGGGLEPGQTVRERYSEAEVIEILDLRRPDLVAERRIEKDAA